MISTDSDVLGIKGFLTIDQTASMLGVHPNTVRKWVQKGKVDVVQVAGHNLIDPKSLVKTPGNDRHTNSLE